MQRPIWNIGIIVLLIGFFQLPVSQAAQKGLDKDIGLILQLENHHDVHETQLFREIFFRTFSNAYGQSVKLLNAPVLKLDEILFLGAQKNLDHVLVLRGNGFINKFDVRKIETRIGFQFRGEAGVYDIAKMQRVAYDKVLLDGSDVLFHNELKGTRENAYGLFSQALIRTLSSFYNPNTLGNAQVRNSADYFYQKGDCEHALPLYEQAMLSGNFDFDAIAIMKQRQEECKLREKTRVRVASQYRLDLEFVNLSANYHRYFEMAKEKGQFSRRFSAISDHPVTLTIRYNSNQNPADVPGEITITFFYDPMRYRVATRLRPKEYDSALDFAPFYRVMELLVDYQRMAIRLMPAQNRAFFSKFQPMIRLEKYNGDWLVFNVQVNPADKPLTPSKMRLKVAGYQPVLVEQSKVVSDPVKYFFLGPAFNPDGKETIYNMVYRYFEIKPS